MAKQSQVKSRRKLLNPVFHLQTKQEDDSQLTKGMIKVVRRTGQLNLSGRGLATVPMSIFTMYESDGKNGLVEYDLSKSPDDAWWSYTPLNYLDLSSNILDQLPENIKMFEDLSVLNLQDNNLSHLPIGIGNLKKLTKLNLSRNKISKLPDEFYALVELQILNLSHNELIDVSEKIGDLIMLQQLDLSNNNLIHLPPGLGYLVRLTDVNLSHNQLTELPSDIVNLRGVTKLDVTHNNLKNLPPRMGEMRKLQTLHAQHNDIENLPSFEGCDYIQELHFGNNYIKIIPSEFCEDAVNLKILDLRDNKIKELPKEIAMLQHVIRFDLGNNELTSLPNTLGLLPHLQNLQIEGNIIKHIRQDIIKGGTSRILKYLRDKLNEEELALSTVATKTFTAEVNLFPNKYTMKNSRSLNLAMKDLTTINIPNTVFDDAVAAEVVVVDLCKNKLASVPEGLEKLRDNIMELNISMNQIKTLPDNICDFKKLQYLDLGKNALDNLPDNLGSLLCLRELVISNNR
ncbi:leucine rich repeat containing protein [Holotrichia oblita]|uniref:Leucine rich repeat containing protein n=1 Tax=Holotrichia oblita TaxID=644536 RepID=A0ACB9T4N4_HOLOL|nr:leucine rich repeat containing protein [Holotrichia oblita]